MWMVTALVPALAMPPPQPLFFAPSAWPRLVSDIVAFTASGSAHTISSVACVTRERRGTTSGRSVPLKQLGQYQSTCTS
jgi:hypothetical protein